MTTEHDPIETVVRRVAEDMTPQEWHWRAMWLRKIGLSPYDAHNWERAGHEYRATAEAIGQGGGG